MTLLRKTVLVAACVLSAAAAFGPSVAQELDATPDETAAFRQNLLELVDSYSELAKQNGLPSYLTDTLAGYREDIEAASDDEFASLATRLGPPVAAATSAVRDMRREIAFDAVPLPGFEKSAGLPGPNYPSVSWTFFIDVFSGTPGGSASDERRSGVCSPPRQSPNLLFFSQNATLVNEATRDIADQICDETIAGFNASLACIITDVLYLVQRGIYDNLILCEDLIDSAELEASFKRLEHVHGDLEDAESNLTGEINSTEAVLAFQIDQVRAALSLQIEQARASLQAEIDANEALLQEVLAAIGANSDRLKSVQAVQKQMLRLLLTPQGRREVEPSVLTCSGDECPNVLACPGDECSYPVK